MTGVPYDKFDHNELILRDWLAADRTVLANQRTFLAYIRTALTALIVGVGLIGYFKTGFYANIGLILVPVGIIILLIGLYWYIKTRNSLNLLYSDKSTTPPGPKP